MNRIRGVVMFLAAAVALWKAWQIHRGEPAVLACALGAMALALAIWHLTRKPVERRPQPRQ